MKTVKYYIQRGMPVTQVVVKKGFKTFPILGILQIIFVVAKIFDKLDWGWFLVFWPLWIIPAIVLGMVGSFFAIMVICFGIACLWDCGISLKRKWKRRNNG